MLLLQEVKIIAYTNLKTMEAAHITSGIVTLTVNAAAPAYTVEMEKVAVTQTKDGILIVTNAKDMMEKAAALVLTV